MVDLRHIAKACAEREAAMTAEEKAERDAKRRKRLERTAKRHERLMAPTRRAIAAMGGFDGLQAAARAVEDAMAPMHAIQDAMNSPALRFAQELSESPAAKMMREFVDSPTARLVRDVQSRPLLEAARGLSVELQSLELPNISMPELAGVDRLRELTRDLQVDTEGRRWSASPELLRPIQPPRDVDQDERFEKLSSVVVAQTDQVVELRREVREVKDSASRDSHRERVQAIRQDRAGTRLQWWHLVLSAVLGAVATRLLELL